MYISISRIVFFSICLTTCGINYAACHDTDFDPELELEILNKTVEKTKTYLGCYFQRHRQSRNNILLDAIFNDCYVRRRNILRKTLGLPKPDSLTYERWMNLQISTCQEFEHQHQRLPDLSNSQDMLALSTTWIQKYEESYPSTQHRPAKSKSNRLRTAYENSILPFHHLHKKTLEHQQLHPEEFAFVQRIVETEREKVLQDPNNRHQKIAFIIIQDNKQAASV